MEAKLAKVYYSLQGLAAIQKLADAANVSKEQEKKFWFSKHPNMFLGRNSMFLTPTRFIKPNFFFHLMTPLKMNVDAKLSNTRSPWSRWPLASKKLNVWPKKPQTKWPRPSQNSISAALLNDPECCRLILEKNSMWLSRKRWKTIKPLFLQVDRDWQQSSHCWKIQQKFSSGRKAFQFSVQGRDDENRKGPPPGSKNCPKW